MDLADAVQEMRDGRRPLPNYDLHMGFRLVKWNSDGAVVEVDVDDRFVNPTGVLHGGVLAGLCDSAMGLTVSSMVAPGHTCANTDLAVRFLRGTKVDVIRASARIVKTGKRMVFMEADVTNEKGELVARATSTFLISEKQGLGR